MSNYVSLQMIFFEKIADEFKQRGWIISRNSQTEFKLSGHAINDTGNAVQLFFFRAVLLAYVGIIGFPINYLMITTTLKKVNARLDLNEYGEIELTGCIGNRSIDRTILGKPQIPEFLMFNKKALLAFFFIASFPTTIIEIAILSGAIQ